MAEEDQIAQLQADLAEFKITSQELERELEAELDESEARAQALESQLAEAQKETQAWRSKHREAQKSAADNENRLAARVDALEKQAQHTLQRMRAVEIENDDMERTGRITQMTLQELEQANAELLERLALAESDRALLGEQLQRANDAQRELNEELAAREIRAEIMQAQQLAVPRSRSLRKVHGMIGQVTLLEGRVETVRKRLSSAPVPRKVSGPRPYPSSASSSRSTSATPQPQPHLQDELQPQSPPHSQPPLHSQSQKQKLQPANIAAAAAHLAAKAHLTAATAARSSAESVPLKSRRPKVIYTPLASQAIQPTETLAQPQPCVPGQPRKEFGSKDEGPRARKPETRPDIFRGRPTLNPPNNASKQRSPTISPTRGVGHGQLL